MLKLIGRGGMGAVYKARQKVLDRIVALKILPPGVGQDPAFAERFTREAKALARLSHPGIVTIHDFGRAGGLYFLIMEFVDGVNLRQVIAGGRMSPREALAIVPEICDALQYAHDQGIVHRDIKPENILLDRRGRVKVADFGLAKLIGGEDESVIGGSDKASPALTEVGKVMGTPQYMAPEQVEHPAAVDHRADIYALGVVLYQMLTGELPGKPLEPPSRKVRLDVRLDEVVLRALESEPARRYQQASQVKTAVETVTRATTSNQESKAAEDRETPQIAVPKIRNTRLRLILGVGLLSLGALVTWWMLRGAIWRDHGSQEKQMINNSHPGQSSVSAAPNEPDWLKIQSLDAWIADLQNPDPKVKKMAQRALRDLGTNALPGILKVLNEPTDDRDVEAIQFIGPGVKYALPQFVALLKSGQQEKAYSGGIALAFSAPAAPEAFSILTNALTDSSPGSAPLPCVEWIFVSLSIPTSSLNPPCSCW